MYRIARRKARTKTKNWHFLFKKSATYGADRRHRRKKIGISVKNFTEEKIESFDLKLAHQLEF